MFELTETLFAARVGESDTIDREEVAYSFLIDCDHLFAHGRGCERTDCLGEQLVASYVFLTLLWNQCVARDPLDIHLVAYTYVCWWLCRAVVILLVRFYARLPVRSGAVLQALQVRQESNLELFRGEWVFRRTHGR